MASGVCAALTGRTHGCTDQPANVKKTLANSEPSTHGTKRTYQGDLLFVGFGGEADMPRPPMLYRSGVNDPKRSFGRIAGVANWPKIWRRPEREVITDRAMEAWYHLSIA
jgi:hypothetical protein